MLDLPRCSVLAARAASDLAPRLPLAFNASGRPLLLAMPGRELPRPGPEWHVLAGRLGRDAIAVTLHPDLLPAQAAAHLADLSALSLPDELRVILLAVLLSELDTLVESWYGQRPEWDPPDSTQAEPGNTLLVLRAAENENSGTEPVALLRLDDGAFARLAERCRDQPIHRARLEDLPVTLDLLLDHAPFPTGELSAIGPGDVVLLGRTMPADEGGLDLVVRIRGSAGFRARYLNASLTITATLDAIMDLPEPGPPTSFDDMQLQVELQIGRLTLPLMRVRELAIGQVLDLGIDATTAVTLRVNGQVLAVGELVRIAERTGVRITELRVEREV
jgi:type III secretion protein Q